MAVRIVEIRQVLPATGWYFDETMEAGPGAASEPVAVFLLVATVDDERPILGTDLSIVPLGALDMTGLNVLIGRELAELDKPIVHRSAGA